MAGGNRSGPKGKYQYITDSGKKIKLRMDKDLATAIGLTASQPGDVTKPDYFTPRGIYCQRAVPQAPDGAGTGEGVTYLARKFIPCNADSQYYKTDEGKDITIEGETFQITGRVGERQTFG